MLKRRWDTSGPGEETGLGTQVTPEPSGRDYDVETAVQRIRWLAAAFVFLQIALLYDPAANQTTIPFPRLPVALVVSGVLVALNVGSLWIVRTRSRQRLRVFGWIQTLLDLSAASALVFLFTFDVDARLWPVFVLPILEGALREKVRGALATAGAALMVITVHEGVAVGSDAAQVVSTLMFRGSILVILALGVGFLARRDADSRSDAEDLAAAKARTVDELRQLDEMKTEFMHVLAHEMGGPITAVSGYARLLRDQGDDIDRDRRDDALEAIHSGTRRLHALVRDVQEAMAADHRELPIRAQPMDLGEIASRVAREQVASRDGHRLEIEADAGLPLVHADADRVGQVVDNLVSNAVKYSPAGGRVHVRISGEDGSVRTAVTDDGPGIPLEDQSRLFQKFSRLQTETSVPGTGLGLYLARQLVEAMDGEIGVDSEVGRGTTFWFTLPAVRG